jgi:transposase
LDNVTEDDLNSLGVTLHEVNAALARETRRRVRKRLIAIGGLLAGQSIQRAAATAKTTPKWVECWLQRVRQSGLPSLLRDRRRRPCKRELTPAELHETRRTIAAALERPLRSQVRTRLTAVDMVLSGQAVADTAARAVVTPQTVQQWVRLVTTLGIRAALARWEARAQAKALPRPLHADPVAFRDLAAKERRQPRRKQMLALALVADGMSPHGAALATGANYGAVLRRIRRFQKEGIAAFHDKERWRKKLAADQIQQLHAEIQERPDMSYPQLLEFVAARFGVSYSLEGLRLLLKRDLGVVCQEGRFIKAALPPPVEQLHQPPAHLTRTLP